jgi:hypothetical protein
MKRFRTNGNGLHAPHPPAGFLLPEALPVDAPRWPLHAALFLEAAPAIVVPQSGLAIERHHPALGQDFLTVPVDPFDSPCVIQTRAEPLRPRPRIPMPQSSLTPLGWDARAILRTQGVL